MAALAKKSSGSHDGSACAHAGYERVGSDRMKVELPPDLWSSGLFMCFGIRLVGELRREKNMRLMFGEVFCHANATEKSTLIAANSHDLRSEAFD